MIFRLLNSCITEWVVSSPIVLSKLVVAQEVLKKFSKVWAKAQQYHLRAVGAFEILLSLVIISWRCDRWDKCSSHCLGGKWRSMEQIKFSEGANWTPDSAIEILRFSPGNSRFVFLFTEFTEVFMKLFYFWISRFFLISRGIYSPVGLTISTADGRLIWSISRLKCELEFVFLELRTHHHHQHHNHHLDNNFQKHSTSPLIFLRIKT